MCRAQRTRKVNTVSDPGEGDHQQLLEQDTEYVFKVNQVHKITSMIEVNIGGVPVKALIDSGASCNIVDEETWSHLKKKKMRCKTSASDGV